jgi:hypothetical protein
MKIKKKKDDEGICIVIKLTFNPNQCFFNFKDFMTLKDLQSPSTLVLKHHLI